MKTFIKIIPCLVLITTSGCFKEKDIDVMNPIANVRDIVAIFPTNTSQLNQLIRSTLTNAEEKINDIVTIQDQARTFENTAHALDEIRDQISRLGSILSTVMNTNPDKEMRTAAEEGLLEISAFNIEKLIYNKPLFKAFEYYVTHQAHEEKLNGEEQYFLEHTMDDYKKSGLLLPDEEQKKLKDLRQEITKHEITFENNINNDLKEILVSEADLQGLADESIATLPTKTVDGVTYKVLDASYPVVTNILENCSVEATRKKVWLTFVNRAYPTNEKVLQELITLRDKLARTLNYKDYAHYDIDDMMAENPETVLTFLASIEPRALAKAKTEFADFTKVLPQGIRLTDDHKINPWDFAYIKSFYKKKHYDIDNRYIAEFFPVESTLKNMFDIYQQFLGLSFEKVPVSGLWDKEVTAIAIRSKDDNAIRGYLLLDLFPRPNKYTHACFGSLTPSLKNEDGSFIPGSGIIIANFPKSTPTQPALLKHDDVVTFFHEFGHALHSILGATELASFAGTSVKDDFVETPSQMFEEWMWDPTIIKSISKHYKTDEPLPDEIITKMVKLKNFDSGAFICRLITSSHVSLDYFSGADKKLQQIMFGFTSQFQPFIQLIPDNHSYDSFGHLGARNYGSKYYNYLWAKFYSLDLFETIKAQGLLNQNVGKQLVEKVLAPGGSTQPMTLLVDFLGREPRSDAFFKNLGM